MRARGRFVLFGIACAIWLGAMTAFAGAPMLQAAGWAWFINWGIQIAVAVTWWQRRFSLPEQCYRPLNPRPRPWVSRASSPRSYGWSRVLGVRLFGRIACRINPLRLDRRCPDALDAAIGAAETTHLTTLGIVSMLTLACMAVRWMTLAGFLTLWNVLFNLYPVAWQRHTRERLHRIATRRVARRHGGAIDISPRED